MLSVRSHTTLTLLSHEESRSPRVVRLCECATLSLRSMHVAVIHLAHHVHNAHLRAVNYLSWRADHYACRSTCCSSEMRDTNRHRRCRRKRQCIIDCAQKHCKSGRHSRVPPPRTIESEGFPLFCAASRAHCGVRIGRNGAHSL